MKSTKTSSSFFKRSFRFFKHRWTIFVIKAIGSILIFGSWGLNLAADELHSKQINLFGFYLEDHFENLEKDLFLNSSLIFDHYKYSSPQDSSRDVINLDYLMASYVSMVKSNRDLLGTALRISEIQEDRNLGKWIRNKQYYDPHIEERFNRLHRIDSLRKYMTIIRNYDLDTVYSYKLRLQKEVYRLNKEFVNKYNLFFWTYVVGSVTLALGFFIQFISDGQKG